MADLGSALQSVLQVPGLQELLNSSITRNRELEPVRTAVAQQAVNMLPNSAFNRPNIGAIPRANYATPAPSAGSNGSGTDWIKLLSILGAGIGGAGALSRLLGGGGNGGGGNLADIVNGLKKLFGHGNGPGNYPLKPGSGFGGPNTSTFSGDDPFGNNLPGFENSFFNDPSIFNGLPSDPSRGSGVGPGMQDYYNTGGSYGGGGDDSYEGEP